MNKTKVLSFTNIHGGKVTCNCLVQVFLIDKNDNTRKIQHENVAVEVIGKSTVPIPPSRDNLWIILAKSISTYQLNVI